MPYFDFCKRYFTVSKIDRSFLKTNQLHKSIPINIHSIGAEISEELFEIKSNKYNRNIIFFGSLDYEPNLSAIYWLLEKVMPKVWEVDSNIILNIAGKNPPKRLINLCNKSKKILLISNPFSMSYQIRKSIIAVLPLVSGSGQQNKILEAIANGLPVITTNKGALPFGFINDKHVLIKDNPSNFASAIMNLYKDHKKINQLRAKAFLKLKMEYTWSAAADFLSKDYIESLTD